MKKTLATLVSVLLLATGLNCAFAKDNSADKERAEHQKNVRKEMTAKASKDARNEAKKLEKEHWKVAPGALPLAKQLDRAYMMQYEYNDEGDPKFMIGSAMSTGATYDAAKMQAMELAKLDLAGQIQSEITALVENDVDNKQITSDEAASVVQTIMSSKNLISQSLGKVNPILEAYQEVGSSRRVMIRVAYNSATAKQVAKKVIEDQLENKSEELHNRLDQLLGW